MTIRRWMELIVIAAWICAVALTPAAPIIVIATLGSVLGVICVRRPWFVFVVYLYLAVVPSATDSSRYDLFCGSCVIGSSIGAMVGVVLQRRRRPAKPRRRPRPHPPIPIPGVVPIWGRPAPRKPPDDARHRGVSPPARPPHRPGRHPVPQSTRRPPTARPPGLAPQVPSRTHDPRPRPRPLRRPPRRSKASNPPARSLTRPRATLCLTRKIIHKPRFAQNSPSIC